MRRLLTWIALSLSLPGLAPAQNVVTTFAGTDYVFDGNGRPATQTQLGAVTSVAVDSQGNVYTADVENHLVYRIAPDGTLTVVAGNGIPGYTGDGGQAIRAAFAGPLYLAIGPRGDLFVGDNVNSAVRRVDVNGIVSTVANYGGIRGLAAGPDGALYISVAHRVDKLQDGVIQVYAGGGKSTGDGVATSIALDAQGIAVDVAGNVYIADGANGRICEVTPDGNLVTIAGGGTSTQEGAPALQTRFRFPAGVALDLGGNIYVADRLRVRRVDINKLVTTVAGNGAAGFNGDGGAATSANLGVTLGVATDSLGIVYIADPDNLRIRRINTDGTIQTIAGSGQTRFSGDGGSAVNATFGIIGGLAFDAIGNLYVSDSANHRVRKIGRDGTIRTAVGTGVAGDTGDEGPGTLATLLSPAGLATTPSGDLFIADRSPGARRIRRFGADGTIHAAVGKPGAADIVGGFRVPIDARQVQMGDPVSITTDTMGNLFFLDSAYLPSIYEVLPSGIIPGSLIPCKLTTQCPPVNYVGELVSQSYSLTVTTQVTVGKDGALYVAVPAAGVYRIESDGTLTLIAGNGKFIPPYDSADGITLDNDGRVVFSNNFYVYRIDPGGIVRLAGIGPFLPQGDGGPATSAGMFPTSPVFDSAGNLYVADQVSQRVRVILANPPAISVAPQSMSFSGTSRGPVPLPQNVSIAGAVPSLGFQVSAVTSDGGAWLKPAISDGLTPRLLEVSVDPSSLSAGDYTGTITISAPLASPPTLPIAVTFHVEPTLPPQLVLDRQNISFAFPQSGAARSEALVLSNTGGGVVNVQVVARTTTGGSWLNVRASGSLVTPAATTTLTVTADPSNLPPQTYRGAILVTLDNGSSRTIPVTMTVSATQKAILLSQSGLSFTAVNGGGVIPPHSFEVVNIGKGSVDWSINVTTLSGGPDWLQVDSTTGSSNSGSVPPSVQVSINAASLDPGVYYGLVRVDADGAANTPQVLSVFLNVLPRGSDPGAIVDASELVFTAVDGGPVPGSQTFLVYNVGASAKSYRSTATRVSILPSSARLDPNQPTQVVVQPTSKLKAGVYSGSVDLQLDDGTVRSVKIRYIVAPAAAPSASAQRKLGRSPASTAGVACMPTTLIPSFTSLSSAYAVTAGWPVPLVVAVKDNCGENHAAGTVTVTFSTGDPPLSLRSLLDGRWAATWSITSGARTKATILVQAKDPDLGIAGTSTVDLGLNQPQDPPRFTADGISSAALTPAFTPIAPGSLITISGTNLAEVGQDAGTPPLPFSLGNTQVLIAGVRAPLVGVTSSTIQAIIPYGVGINTTQQILINRGTTYSRPIPVDVAPAQPAIFLGADGLRPQIFALHGANSTLELVTDANPAAPGDTLLINCAGLGAVNPLPDDGTLPSTDARPVTTAPVGVMFGTLPAQADFAGLDATQIGHYQVRVVVPATLSSAVSLTIVVNGQTSPAVPLSIRSSHSTNSPELINQTKQH